MARSPRTTYPIKHWSYSSLLSFLRNPLAWHKRYVEGIYDMPSGPAAVIGRSGHKALEHFYSQVKERRERTESMHAHDRMSAESKVFLGKLYKGLGKEESIAIGLEYLRSVPDFEINFGVAKSTRAQKAKRALMEKEYLQAVGFYLKRAPRYSVVGVEVMGMAHVPGIPLPLKAISDLVVESRDGGGIDIIDHKFVDSFSSFGDDKPLFILQAIFNYYTVTETYGLPVKNFILQECKKKKNRDGKSQMRRHIIRFEDYQEDFELFHRLLKDVSEEIVRRRIYLPNPSDMFEGKNSFEIYRMGLVEEN